MSTERNAPKTPVGTASRTASGMIQLSYCAASDKKTSSTENIKMIFCVFPTETS